MNPKIIMTINNDAYSTIAKKLFISQFFKQIKLCLRLLLFLKKFLHLKKCFYHVYVYAMALT